MPKQAVVRHWLTTVVVECPNCDAGATILLVGAAPAQCPACGEYVVCGGLEWNSEHPGSPLISIGRPTKLVPM